MMMMVMVVIIAVLMVVVMVDVMTVMMMMVMMPKAEPERPNLNLGLGKFHAFKLAGGVERGQRLDGIGNGLKQLGDAARLHDLFACVGGGAG